MTPKELSFNTKILFNNLLGIIVCLPLPLASNRPWAWSLMEAWIFCVFAVWLFHNGRGKAPLPDYWKKFWLPVLALSCFAAFTLFQLSHLNTGSKSIFVLEELQWTQVSLDPYATTGYFLKTLAYICLFILTVALVNTEERVKKILQAFFFSGLIQAVYGSFMTLTGLEYGFFMKKEAYVGNATGTFINRNHFANYLVMCTAAGTALMLIDICQYRFRSWKTALVDGLNFLISKKMLSRLGLAVIIAGIGFSVSRMGFVSLILSIFAAITLWIIFTKRLNKGSVVFLALLVLALWIVTSLFGLEQIIERLQNTSINSETRDEVIRDSLAYIDQHLLYGSGAGSYYSVYPYYKSPDVNGLYEHAHNDYIQFVSEYGVIGTSFIALFVLSSAFIAITTMLKRRNPVMQAAGFTGIMIIVALLLHSLVDFNLQMMANAASAVILLGLCWTVRYLPTNIKGARN